VGQKDRVSITGDMTGCESAVTGLAGVTDVSVTDRRLDILVDDAGSMLPDILARVTAAGGNINGVEVVEPNLEAVFLHLTGRALRD
jgi:ABC-2 type transport system ATP-binding protein